MKGVQRAATRTGEAGFTLMELVVAVFIVAVMAAVVTPHLLGIGQNAESNACEQNQRMIRAALSEYYLIYHNYPQGTADEQLKTLKDAKLIESIPEEPSGGHYQITETDGEVEVSCDVHGELPKSKS
ncbi:competence type IV pilus major pilin ComGC [Alicyclobacillus pomorum]|uniref:competence type IV pilus major pilin ComGC n=1 Tax=Alicyclobacillus pomorum TaxID=204470 RepID=UPI00040A3014|nr:prepilin-type N-terminal cleavage/methylation domain-containing protein [Alicyclobacillus pomorum]